MSRSRKRSTPARVISGPAPQGFSGYAFDAAYDAGIPTDADIRKRFGPVKTLGLPAADSENMELAMDSMLEGSGFYGLIQHAFALGQPPQGNGFIGYAALSDLKQNGLVSACVETVVDDMVREWIDFEREGSEKKGNTADDIIPAIKDRAKELKLRKVFRTAAAHTQYFGGCLIFIDTGIDDPSTLKMPLDISNKSGELGLGKLRGFTVIEPINVFPGNYNSFNPLSNDYFEPQSWWVLGREVHASRFIKLSSGDVPVLLRPSYNFFGVPHAQILWDYVLHFQKDRVATSRMLGKYSDFIFKVAGLRDAMLTPAGTVWLDSKIKALRYRSNDGIQLVDKDHEDVAKVESSMAGLVDIKKSGLEDVCAINRTPAVKLLGISPSGFNATGDSDIRNYYDHISSQCEKILSDGIAKALDCIQLDVAGRIDPGITFKFNELGGEDRQIESGIRQANADKLFAGIMSDCFTTEGAQAAIEANPDEYPAGFVDAIKVDRERLEAAAGGELDAYSAEYAVAGAETVEAMV
jgi:phage-related protein (TIGR01555 family)